MRPALKPSAAARVRREANRTSDGTKTTAPPSAVAAPGTTDIPKGRPSFGSSIGILMLLCRVLMIDSMREMSLKLNIGRWVGLDFCVGESRNSKNGVWHTRAF